MATRAADSRGGTRRESTQIRKQGHKAISCHDMIAMIAVWGEVDLSYDDVIVGVKHMYDTVV
jgi:hypothetical protein